MGLSLRDRWLFALKPASWPKLLVAAALGQAIGIAATGKIDPAGVVAGLCFTVFHLAFVVLINDWGDQEVDALKRRLFGEACSPKTIPDGVLEAQSVLWAGAGAAAMAIGIAVAAQVVLGRPGLIGGGIVCVGLLAVYTLPPIRMNYRGGGEVLEMIGVGFVLPWWNAYVQGGAALPAGLVVLPGYALLCLASALASGLGDEASDRLGGKRTFTTMFGASSVRQAVEGLMLGAMIVWAILPRLAPHYATPWMVLPAVIVMAMHYRELREAGQAADIETPVGVRAYKRHLHDCVWHGAGAMAVSILVAGVLGGGLGSLSGVIWGMGS